MQYFNNVLTNEELFKIHSIVNTCKWGFDFWSNNPECPIWNFDKETGRPIAELLLSKLDKPYKLLDWHINGQTFQLSASWHCDNLAGCTHSFVFFPKEWQFEWGGRLHIKINDDEIMVINPIGNTGILFDASLPHYAEAPVVNKLRISIGLKLCL